MVVYYSERRDYERVKRKSQQICCRLYPFSLLDEIRKVWKFLCGRSPNWVNHVYLCFCFICIILYIISASILLLCDPIF